MKKSVFLLLFMGIGIGNIARANDCHLFTKTSMRAIEGTLFENSTKENPALTTLTMEGLHRALINLKTHCCASNILNNNPEMLASCEKDKNLLTEKTNYPQSSFLFDHIIDVAIRRLVVDGNYGDVPLDPKAQTRREQKDKNIEAENWTIPPTLARDYKENRSIQEKFLVPEYNGVSRGEYKKSLEKEEEKRHFFEKHKERNLTTKYQNLCQSSIYIMALLPIDFRSEELTLAQQQCKSLTNQLIEKEAEHLSKAIIHKSDLLLQETMKTYTDEYLVNTRGKSFQEKLTRMTTNLFWIVIMIPKLIPICN